MDGFYGACDGPDSRIRDRVVKPSGSPPREALHDVNRVMQALWLDFAPFFIVFLNDFLSLAV